MRADPAYRSLQKLKQARSEYLAQEAAQTSPATSDGRSFADIAAKYDVTNISLCEIDQLAEDLRSGGTASFGNLLMLEAHGEEFLSHLPGDDYTESRLTRRIDLLGEDQRQRDMARRSGDPTDAWDRQVEFLEEIRDAA